MESHSPHSSFWKKWFTSGMIQVWQEVDCMIPYTTNLYITLIFHQKHGFYLCRLFEDEYRVYIYIRINMIHLIIYVCMPISTLYTKFHEGCLTNVDSMANIRVNKGCLYIGTIFKSNPIRSFCVKFQKIKGSSSDS